MLRHQERLHPTHRIRNVGLAPLLILELLPSKLRGRGIGLIPVEVLLDKGMWLMRCAKKDSFCLWRSEKERKREKKSEKE